MPQGHLDEITVQQRGPQPVPGVRATLPTAQLADARGEALRNHLQQHGAMPLGPPGVRYHTFGDAETDMEVGVTVAEGAVGEGRVNPASCQASYGRNLWMSPWHENAAYLPP